MALEDTFNAAGTVRLTGLEPVLKRLKELPEKMEKKILKDALRKGATVIRTTARSNLKTIDDPKTKEKIWKNVAVIFASRKSKKGNQIVMSVGVRGGAKQYADTRENRRAGRVGKKYKTLGDKGSIFGSNPGGDTWYWRFVEFGVPAHGIPGRQPMLNALMSSASKTMDVVIAETSKGIDKAFSVGPLPQRQVKDESE